MNHKTLHELINLSGQTAIVTGGAMGIGKGIVVRLHEAGANIIIADLDQTAARQTADELNAKRPGSVVTVQVDVSKAGDVERMVKTAIDTFSVINILVNNAGIFPFVPLASLDEASFMKVIDVNLRGVYLCTKQVSDRMKTQGKGGRIINVASVDALHPSAVGLAAYDASKHGAWGFTKNVALELAEYKIWVNAIAPGGIATPGVAKLMQGQPQRDPGAGIPMKRLGDPDEMGRVALFLASDLSSYMTGSVIVADGGVLLA